MGAGISRKQINGRIYRRLKAIGRDLHKAGVPTSYTRGGRLVFEGTGLEGGFNISYAVSRASNGEAFGMPTIWLSHQGVAKQYGFCDTGGTFEQGIAFIKANFKGGTHATA